MIWFLQTLAWLACVVYSTVPLFWILIHPFAEYWRSRRRSPHFVLLAVWMALWATFAAASAPWRQVTLYSVPWSWGPAALFLSVGVWLYVRSGKHFTGKQLRGDPELHAGHTEQRLVVTGIRARVRHPIYLGHLCEILGWSIGSGLAVCYGLTLFTVISGAFMVRMEEQELERRFGQDYRSYRERVPALLPRI